MLTQLAAIQERAEWPDAEMARRLGIARSTWTDIRNGKLALSSKVQMAAARAFPELLGELVRTVSTTTPQSTPEPV
jgi:hypothetical protein